VCVVCCVWVVFGVCVVCVVWCVCVCVVVCVCGVCVFCYSHTQTSLFTSFPYLCQAINVRSTTCIHIFQVTKTHAECAQQWIHARLTPAHTPNGAASETTTGRVISMELAGWNIHSPTGMPCTCTTFTHSLTRRQERPVPVQHEWTKGHANPPPFPLRNTASLLFVTRSSMLFPRSFSPCLIVISVCTTCFKIQISKEC
jgi:hypothetical protein